MMNPTQTENREELLSLAVDLLGDVILLDCILERLSQPGQKTWDGPVRGALLNRLYDFIRISCQQITFLSCRLTEAPPESPYRSWL